MTLPLEDSQYRSLSPCTRLLPWRVLRSGDCSAKAGAEFYPFLLVFFLAHICSKLTGLAAIEDVGAIIFVLSPDSIADKVSSFVQGLIGLLVVLLHPSVLPGRPLAAIVDSPRLSERARVGVCDYLR